MFSARRGRRKPPSPAWLRHARALGAQTDNGDGMNVYQAVEQFRLFTGLAPDAARVREHFDTIWIILAPARRIMRVSVESRHAPNNPFNQIVKNSRF
jgi:hypothetical protein